jgi:hypothetical protein
MVYYLWLVLLFMELLEAHVEKARRLDGVEEIKR